MAVSCKSIDPDMCCIIAPQQQRFGSESTLCNICAVACAEQDMAERTGKVGTSFYISPGKSGLLKRRPAPVKSLAEASLNSSLPAC